MEGREGEPRVLLEEGVLQAGDQQVQQPRGTIVLAISERKAAVLDRTWASKGPCKAHERTREQWGPQSTKLGTQDQAQLLPRRNRTPLEFWSASHTGPALPPAAPALPVTEGFLGPWDQGPLKALLSLARGSGMFWAVGPLGTQEPGLGGQDYVCENLGSGNSFPRPPECLSLSLSQGIRHRRVGGECSSSGLGWRSAGITSWRCKRVCILGKEGSCPGQETGSATNRCESLISR